MEFEDIIVDYSQELSLLYKPRLDSYPTLFDHDQYIHGFIHECCFRCFGDRSKR
jgi:hypothetical protein